MKTIEQLRKENYKVRVMHFRYVNDMNASLPASAIKNAKLTFNPKGGSTRIELRTPEGQEVFGEALCSKSDTFNRRVGNKIALDRAFHALENPILNPVV